MHQFLQADAPTDHCNNILTSSCQLLSHNPAQNKTFVSWTFWEQPQYIFFSRVVSIGPKNSLLQSYHWQFRVGLLSQVQIWIISCGVLG